MPNPTYLGVGAKAKAKLEAAAVLKKAVYPQSSKANLVRFVGKTTALVKAIWQAPLHYRALQRMINSVASPQETLRNMVTKFNTKLRLTKEAETDLQWWVSLDRKIRLQAPLLPRTPNMIIKSDASTTGWGAHQGEVRTGGGWLGTEALNHTNYLELLAAFLAIQCFAKQERSINILVKMDTVTAVTYLNKMGGTHSLDLCQLALSMWAWCLQWDIYLMAEHLPGKENLVADEESRMMKDRCDWMLNPAIFNRIQLQMGPCKIDLFASRLTRQLPRFYSWRPDPEAENTDAFSQNWSTTWGFVNPPWCLIPRALSQAKQQQARVIMITPLWVTQLWYPTILEMLEDYPCLLTVRQDLVILPTPQDEFIMK